MGLIRDDVVALQDSPILEVWRTGAHLPDMIGMWAGEPDVPTPAFICRAASQALAEGHTFYSAERGIPELRAEIASYLERLYGTTISDDRIAVTQSGMNAVMLISQMLLRPGDNVVAVTPGWPNVTRAMQINGAAIREVPLEAGNRGWRFDPGRVFAACDGRTRIISFASPGNPTGWTIEREQAEALLAFARERGIALLSDEVYHRIVYDGRAALSLLELARPGDPVFVVNSFSKAWAMTGWRLGWMVFPEGITGQVNKLIQFNTSGAQAFLQWGAIAALRDGEEFVSYFVDRCRTGQKVVAERLAAMPRVRPIVSNGSFYAMFEVDGMADSLRFCLEGVQKMRLGMAPGTAFGGGAERMVRLCYAKEPALLHAAMNRLATLVAGYRE